MKTTIQYSWRTVADHRQLMNDFSANCTPCHSRVDLSGPQVYRFLFSGKLRSSYLGQSNNFRRRYREYRRRNEPTERYLRGYIHSVKSRKCNVELQFLDFEQLDLSGVLVVRKLLGSSHVRKMLESWAVLRDERSGIHVLNSKDDPSTKAPGHPDDFVRVKKKSRASYFREIDKLSGTPTSSHSLGG